MPTPEEQYDRLVAAAKEDSGVIAFILAGGRGKGMTTEHSDYDIFIITEDAVVEGAKIKYQPYTGHAFDINIMGRRELSIFGVWGSDTMWARYNFAHIKAVFDKTGEIQKWLEAQELIPLAVFDEAYKEALDNYMNYTHRSLKNFRDLRGTAAHLAACDAVPQLLTFLFTAEGRIRPYNEYIEWELRAHPLANVTISPADLSKKIGEILGNGNQETQKELLALVRTIAAKSKIGVAVMNSWKEYYFG
jgi:hypothetical protein